MNILANYRKLFPKNKQVANNIISDPKWEEFLKDWNNIINSTTEAEYNTHLAKFQKYEGQAVQYVQDTWLDPWKENFVQFWVDMIKHFGVRFTSLIEGCHAMLKAYLRVSTGDLKGIYDHLLNFWLDQHLKI